MEKKETVWDVCHVGRQPASGSGIRRKMLSRYVFVALFVDAFSLIFMGLLAKSATVMDHVEFEVLNSLDNERLSKPQRVLFEASWMFWAL